MSSSPDAVSFAQLTPVAAPAPAPSVEAAASKAHALIAAAEAEADRIRSAAFASGFEAGREEIRAELQPSVAALMSVIESVRTLEAEMADRVEPQAVELAVQVAERVVAGTIAVEPTRVLDVIRGALRTMVERERLSVLVNPEDLPFVREAMPEVEVHEERRVSRGGAIVRTHLGEVDASIETKLARAHEALVAELAS